MSIRLITTTKEAQQLADAGYPRTQYMKPRLDDLLAFLWEREYEIVSVHQRSSMLWLYGGPGTAVDQDQLDHCVGQVLGDDRMAAHVKAVLHVLNAEKVI